MDARQPRSDLQSGTDADALERDGSSITWNGRLERTENRRESVVPDPGEYEIRAFVATHENRYRPSDSTTIRIE
ncbi:hypothetical protein [Halopiger djelfimassiliensis]|uniref:hypothetical protein n=1 Tax=Halopiger djelfimassiliensis TaxID=1293047 RepID=UPI0006778E5E|nr:hypothetical protein [Halopiger djelfimassiliensis]